MEEKKEKKVGFMVLVYWYDQKKPDVFVLHRLSEKSLCAWIDTMLSDAGNSITYVEVNQFYY